MDAVDSMPSSPSILPMNNDNDMRSEDSLPSSLNEHNNDPLSVMTNVINHTTFFNSDVNNIHTKARRLYRSFQHCSINGKNGLVYVKKGPLSSPTLRICRYSKYFKLNGEMTRKLKVKHTLLRRQQLEDQVRELESKQNNLMSQVENLYSYKHQLEIQWQQTYSNDELLV